MMDKIISQNKTTSDPTISSLKKAQEALRKLNELLVVIKERNSHLDKLIAEMKEKV